MVQIEIALAVFFIFMLTSQLGRKFHWYCKVKYYDMIPHFFGGMALSFFTREILIAIFVILGWEIIEFWLAKNSDHEFIEGAENKLIDIFTGLIGFFIGLVLF